MNEGDNALAIIIIFLLVLMPVGWIVLAYSAEPYYIVTGEPLREAAQAAGVKVVNTTDILWQLPGATGGKAYVLSDNAGNTLAVQTQTFDSAESRDAAIKIFNAQSVGKGKPAGTLLVIGHQVIYISPDPGGILSRIGPELKKKQAVQ
jgi:hypothetical protein